MTVNRASEELEERVATLERAVAHLESAVAALTGILWRNRVLTDDDWTTVFMHSSGAAGTVSRGPWPNSG